MTPEELALRDRIAGVLHAYPGDFGLVDVDEIPTWDAITLADAVVEDVIVPLLRPHLTLVGAEPPGPFEELAIDDRNPDYEDER